jgi:serine/threonine-protein kinase
VTRFEYVLGDNQPGSSPLGQQPIMAIAPNGRSLVFNGRGGLYLRSMDELTARLLPGTAGAMTPFFSPDGEWLSFFAPADGSSRVLQLRKLAIGAGAPVTVCDVVGLPSGASWAADNTILFGQSTGIMRVSADGGKPELVVAAGERDEMYGPQLLPDGRSVLFSVTQDQGPNRWAQGQVVVQPLASSERTAVVGGRDAHYVPSGHLVYAVRDALFAIAFDARNMKAIGSAVPLAQGTRVPVGVLARGANFAVSNQGTLAYLTGGSASNSLVWKGRSSSEPEPISSIPPGSFESPRLSPDGARVLVTQDDDIWIYELASGRSNRLTRDSASQMGVWDPTGAQVAYSSAHGGNLEAWVTPSDGGGEPRQLTTLGGQVHVDSWSPDGRLLAVHHHPSTAAPVKVFLIPMDRTGQKPQPFLEGTTAPEATNFSRDGRYAVYLSVDSGRREIYVRAYSGAAGQATVSVGGGQEPMWADSGEVFYRSLDGSRMFAVQVTTAPALRVGTPVEIFRGPYYVSPTASPRPQYDVTDDGQRFLMLAPSGGASSAAQRIVVVQNWDEMLNRIVPR